MRYEPIDPRLFTANRTRLQRLLLPNSLVALNANDICPTNADGTMATLPNSDLFYLSGIEQEQTLLLLYPDADEEKHREILFLREPTPENELWEGHKLTRKEAQAITGIQNVQWLSEFRRVFHRLMCECDHVYLNSNEHKRAVIEVESREARFVRDTQSRYPLHRNQRLDRLLHQLRVVKSPLELDLIRKACALTKRGFERVLRSLQPGMNETEVEAELAYQFIRGGGTFAYLPIIAIGASACVLHYLQNDA